MEACYTCAFQWVQSPNLPASWCALWLLFELCLLIETSGSVSLFLYFPWFKVDWRIIGYYTKSLQRGCSVSTYVADDGLALRFFNILGYCPVVQSMYPRFGGVRHDGDVLYRKFKFTVFAPKLTLSRRPIFPKRVLAFDPCFCTWGRNVKPVSISTPRYVAVSNFAILTSLYLMTGGLAVMLPFRINSLDLWLDMVILVFLAPQFTKIFIVWFPLSSICLHVSPDIRKATFSEKSMGVTPWGNSRFKSESKEMFHSRGPRAEPCGHPLVMLVMTSASTCGFTTIGKCDIYVWKIGSYYSKNGLGYSNFV